MAYLSASDYYYNHVSHDIIYCKVGKQSFPGNDMLVDGETEKIRGSNELRVHPARVTMVQVELLALFQLVQEHTQRTHVATVEDSRVLKCSTRCAQDGNTQAVPRVISYSAFRSSQKTKILLRNAHRTPCVRVAAL